jgi:hypothetical protein
VTGSQNEVALTDRIGVGVLTRLIDRDLVDEVLAETGRVEQRRRLLPARVVVYYVLALCLFFGDAYEEVMRKLVGGLQWLHAIGEIVQRLNPPRRHRSCPRAVKRGRLKNQRAKRAADRNIAHDNPAEIRLLQGAA